MSDGRVSTTADLASSGSGPRVVALGGGHGLSVALRAIRRYAGSVTAIVSVADDGGSSGRLRRDLGVGAPGDLRKCLVALAGEGSRWSEAFEHRFSGGELDGHALGNLILVGLAETLGGYGPALEEAARTLDAVGRVLPATQEAVVLKAAIGAAHGAGESEVQGQVAVANSTGIRRVELVPGDAHPPDAVVAELAAADQVVLAPGSLYTSLLPVLCVHAITRSVVEAPGQVVQVANLAPEPETAGLDGTGQLRQVLDHGARVDVYLHERSGGLTVDADRVRAWGVEPVAAALQSNRPGEHDPDRLALALGALL